MSASVAPILPPCARRAPVPRRIVYVWDADYPWDVRVEKVGRALREAGHAVHIVARNRAAAPVREERPEGVVHRMRPWRWAGRLDAALGFPAFFNPRWRSLLDDVVREVRPDVIIARDLPLCPTALGAGRRHGVPVLLDMAEHYPEMIRDIYTSGRQRPFDYLVRNPAAVEAVERHCVRRAAGVLVVVDEMADRLVAMGVPRDRITLVSNTPPAATAARPVARDGRGESLHLVYLGMLELPRGIQETIEAVALLRDRGVSVRLSLIGSGRDHELLQARARELGVDDREVRFLGFIPRERALELVASADVGLLPHRRSPQVDHTVPNKLFDYMAAGLPVVTSDTLPLARLVHATDCGDIFASHDPRALAEAILRLADPVRRRRLGENGRRAVLEEHNWERDTAALLGAVEAAIGTSARGRE